MVLVITFIWIGLPIISVKSILRKSMEKWHKNVHYYYITGSFIRKLPVRGRKRTHIHAHTHTHTLAIFCCYDQQILLKQRKTIIKFLSILLTAMTYFLPYNSEASATTLHCQCGALLQCHQGKDLFPVIKYAMYM